MRDLTKGDRGVELVFSGSLDALKLDRRNEEEGGRDGTEL